MSGDALAFSGVVLESTRGVHVVEVDVGGGSKRRVQAKLSGRLQVNHIKVIPGDVVEVEVSPYDLAKGRIVYRGRREARQ
jgi:translation initiation factor IF-1